nr:cytochrome b/b6 domain-containing protein [Arthrobacter jiangjiafuii]
MGAPAAPALPPDAAPAKMRMGSGSGTTTMPPPDTPAPGISPATPRESGPAAPAQGLASASADPAKPSGKQGDPGARRGTGFGFPWTKRLAALAGLLAIALVVVLASRWLLTVQSVEEFVATYDGHASQPVGAPTGLPAWLGWQHFLNMFFMVLIVRTGLQVRNERKPPGYWTPKKDSLFSPKGNTPKKVSLTQWLHQSLDVFWVLNGLVFMVLLFVTGQWMRIVPTSWDIFPNMLSAGLQYAALDWPMENGWIHYNALQVMAYFITVFIAAPLAIISGIRFSTWWPEKATRLSKAYPVEWARAVHVPVMVYYVAFTAVHVFLVFFTGALRNLNHMYTSRDVVDWWGLVIFLGSLVVVAAAWLLSKPLFTSPVAAKMGKLSK